MHRACSRRRRGGGATSGDGAATPQDAYDNVAYLPHVRPATPRAIAEHRFSRMRLKRLAFLRSGQPSHEPTRGWVCGTGGQWVHWNMIPIARFHACRDKIDSDFFAAHSSIADSRSWPARGYRCRADKAAISAAIESRAEPTWQAALQIWEWAEPGYQEVKSPALLADMLEREGFKVERGVAGIPTAFTADGWQRATRDRHPGRVRRPAGAVATGRARAITARAGTATARRCGHHLFGAASAAAAIAVAEQLKKDKLPGTVRFYGCPAEEGGAAKVVHGPRRTCSTTATSCCIGTRQPQRGRAMPRAWRGSRRSFVSAAPAPMRRPRPSRGARPSMPSS